MDFEKAINVNHILRIETYGMTIKSAEARDICLPKLKKDYAVFKKCH